MIFRSKTIFPPRLDRTKAIGIIAPADPVAGVCPPETVERGLSYLKDKGFKVKVGASVKALAQGHTAGDIGLRVKDIHDMVSDPEVGCIMAFWGGFNTNQILGKLDYELIKANPKIFIGYSDVTALTAAIASKTGLVTFSGPGVISFAKPDPFEYTWKSFESICIDPKERIQAEISREYADDLYFLRDDSDHRIKKPNEGLKAFRLGKAKGEAIAGNLQTLLVLQGTEYAPKLKGRILFIEEDETSTPAHMDRFICQCQQLGWFEQIAGLVIGRLTEQSRFSKEDSLESILGIYLKDAAFPILYNADFGHSDPLMTIPHGGICEIDADAKSIAFERSVR